MNDCGRWPWLPIPCLTILKWSFPDISYVHAEQSQICPLRPNLGTFVMKLNHTTIRISWKQNIISRENLTLKVHHEQRKCHQNYITDKHLRGHFIQINIYYLPTVTSYPPAVLSHVNLLTSCSVFVYLVTFIPTTFYSILSATSQKWPRSFDNIVITEGTPPMCQVTMCQQAHILGIQERNKRPFNPSIVTSPLKHTVADTQQMSLLPCTYLQMRVYQSFSQYQYQYLYQYYNLQPTVPDQMNHIYHE